MGDSLRPPSLHSLNTEVTETLGALRVEGLMVAEYTEPLRVLLFFLLLLLSLCLCVSVAMALLSAEARERPVDSQRQCCQGALDVVSERLAIKRQAPLAHGTLGLLREDQMIGLVQEDAEQLQSKLLGAELLEAAAFQELRVEGGIGQGQRQPLLDAPVGDVHLAHGRASEGLVLLRKRSFRHQHVTVREAAAQVLPPQLDHHKVRSAKQDFVVGLTAPGRNGGPALLDRLGDLPR